MATTDPLVSAWFGVEFQGQVVGAFRECTGMGSENEVVEYKASGPKGEFVIHKVPGRMKWNNITLKRGITDAIDMWKWRKLVEDGEIDQARKNGSIVMFNQAGTEMARWHFFNAWPSKLTGPTTNANNNEVGIEEMELTVEGYYREGAPPKDRPK
jgi:phage tail-like protein